MPDKTIHFFTRPLQWGIFICLFLAFGQQVFGGDSQTNINQVSAGMPVSELEETMGAADKVKEVVRYYYDDWGQVVVKNHKINDIRLLSNGNDNNSPLWRRDQSKVDEDTNKLRFLRIGYSETEMIEIAGPASIVSEGKDYYYSKGSVIVETNNEIVTKVNRDVDTGLARLDWVKLNFSPLSLLIMNITIAFIMFGVALEIKPESFKQIIKEPKSLILGIFSQFLALPALTFLLIYFLEPTPSVALGMILVAACPGGNVSNFMSSLAKGNTALSISLTAFATIAAIFMTPVNFAFWGQLYSKTSSMVIPIEIDFIEILRTVMLLLGLPVVLGIWFSKSFPEVTRKITGPIKKLSMIIFLLFIIGALLGNLDFFMSYIHLIIFIVLGHNALALLTGFIIGSLGKVARADRRSLTIETGIQNSGLGLVLIFNPRLFDGLGGMAFIAAWWGIWHIISGLIMAYLWSRKPLASEDLSVVDVKTDK
jgi:BASS family bile acid:Na+ symporter